MTKNPSVLKWLNEMTALLTPDVVVWVDGTDEQREELRRLAYTDLDGALKLGLEMTLSVLRQQGSEISPASRQALEYLNRS